MASQANVGKESTSGDLHEAPPYISVLAGWRAKFRHSDYSLGAVSVKESIKGHGLQFIN